MVDQEATVTVKLSREAEEGLYWTLLLMTHPKSPVAAGVLVLGETVWPLARALEKDKMLAQDIQLGKKRPREILSNEDMEKKAQSDKSSEKK
jgi:hypothetical protein